jgi:hypothetical protein
MTDFLLTSIWLLLVLLSPHPVIGLVSGPVVYVAVKHRMWFAVRQTSHQHWKANR